MSKKELHKHLSFNTCFCATQLGFQRIFELPLKHLLTACEPFLSWDHVFFDGWCGSCSWFPLVILVRCLCILLACFTTSYRNSWSYPASCSLFMKYEMCWFDSSLGQNWLQFLCILIIISVTITLFFIWIGCEDLPLITALFDTTFMYVMLWSCASSIPSLRDFFY